MTVLLISAFTLLGCGTCALERGIHSVVDAGVEAAEREVPEEGRDEMEIARGITDVAGAAVQACELLRDGAGWQQLVTLMLEATTGAIAQFTGAADEEAGDPPPELLEAHAALEAEVASWARQ